MTETLKPCPFCGDKAVLKEDLRWHGAFRVECSSCDATVWATGENNPASAIAHWNRRAAPREPGEAERRLVPGLGGLQVRYNCALPTGCAFGDSGARLIATFNAAMAAPRPDAGDGTGET